MKNIFTILLAGLLTGCGSMGARALKPGHATIVTPGQSQTIVQSENPQEPSTQTMETEKEDLFTLPALSEMQFAEKTPTATNITTIKTSEPMPVTKRETHKATATVGAAQKDTARDLAARFAAVRPVQYVGVLLILAACALAYFGWFTKAALVGAVGVGMIIVASVIPGHELLILAVGGAVAVIGALLVLYTYHKGTLDSLLATGKADALKAVAAVETASASAMAPIKTVAVPAAIPSPALSAGSVGPLS